VSSISCLMLDLGGVLTQEQRLDKVDEMMALLGAGCGREAFHAAYYGERSDYDRGRVDGAGYWERVASRLALEPPDGRAPELVRADLESWFNMRPAMMGFLGRVKGRLGRTVLLSNIHVDGARYVRTGPARSWSVLFDSLVLSCEHLLLKPEAAIYELALAQAGARAEETLFVDDNADNVEGARAAGLASFRFVGEEDFLARMAQYGL
jgi:putative hydrolase of the HAD superfamily